MPALADTLPKQIQQHIEAGRYSEARRDLQSDLMSQPKNLNIRYHLAVLMQQAGHDAQAVQLYQKNMTYGWHLATVVNLATIYQQNNKIDQATSLLEKAAHHFRSEAVPWYMLADLAYADNHINDADALFRKALRADPLNGFAHIRYARFLADQQQSKKAVSHATRAIKLLPQCAKCLTINGNVHLAAGHTDHAIAAYQKSLAIQPDSHTRQQLIHALQKLGKVQQAQRMQQALDSWKKHQ